MTFACLAFEVCFSSPAIEDMVGDCSSLEGLIHSCAEGAHPPISYLRRNSWGGVRVWRFLLVGGQWRSFKSADFEEPLQTDAAAGAAAEGDSSGSAVED